jgi:hypothetical protein
VLTVLVYFLISGSLWIGCLPKTVTGDRTLVVDGAEYVISYEVVISDLGEKLQVRARISISSNVGELAFTPPLMDMEITTDRETVKWSEGKVFPPFINTTTLPVTVTLEQVVEGDCLRNITIFVRALNAEISIP